MVFCVTKDPEHRIGLPFMKTERLSALPVPVNPKRGRVSRICIVQFATAMSAIRYNADTKIDRWVCFKMRGITRFSS